LDLAAEAGGTPIVAATDEPEIAARWVRRISTTLFLSVLLEDFGAACVAFAYAAARR